jgi:hypothetical protein
MKSLIFVFFIFCAFESGASSMTKRYEKGFFSLGLHSGMTQSRTLNSDATYAKFDGTSLGLQLEISLWQEDSGSIRFYTNWTGETAKEKDGGFKVDNTSISGGFKFYANSYIYMQSGYGEISQKYKSTNSYKVKNNFLSVGLGFDYPITESFSVGVLAQYVTNPIKKTPDINTNSFQENGFYGLVLTWSPPITIINTTVNSR